MTFKKPLPQTKLLVSAIICVAAALSSFPLFSFIFITLIITTERVSPEDAAKASKPFFVLTLIIGISTFFTDGAESALNIFIKFSVFAETVVYTTLTTTDTELENAFAYYLRPLEKLHFPARDTALMLSAALRFIPFLSEERERIAVARLARGIDITKLPLSQRIRLTFESIIPLFASGIHRADTMSTAIDARLYSGKAKIPRKKVFFSYSDLFLAAITVLFCIFSILFEFLH